MQSILLNSANKTQASERLQDPTTSETSKQQRSCFSDVLDVALQETEGNEVKASHTAHSAETDTNIDGELSAKTLSEESLANDASAEDLDESAESQDLQRSDELQDLDDSDELEDLGAVELFDNTGDINLIEDKQSLANAALFKESENESVLADGAASDSIKNDQVLADETASDSIKNAQAIADGAASDSINNAQAIADGAASDSIKNAQAIAGGAASEGINNAQAIADGAASEGINNAQTIADSGNIQDPVNTSADVDPSLVFGKVTANNEDNIKENKPAGAQLDDLTEDAGTPEILAQIQAAQKIDTQVNEPAKVAEESLAPLAGLKKGAEKDSAHIEQSAATSATSALTGEESAESITLKETKSEALQTTEGKLQAFSFTNSNSNEIEPHSLSTAIDGTGLHSVNMNSTNLDKLINQNVHNTVPLAAQHPALDLQAKHASALLGERVLMMISEGKQEVQIRLDPAELGSLFVKLQVQQDQLQLTIQTQFGQSRDIIEQHLPKLREQLAQQGVNLGEANVEQQSQQQQQNQQQKNAIQHNSARLAGDGAVASSSEKTEWRASSIAVSAQGVDYYA